MSALFNNAARKEFAAGIATGARRAGITDPKVTTSLQEELDLRHWGDFEEEACGDGDEGEDEQPVCHASSGNVLEAAVEGAADIQNAGAGGEAVKQREAVGEDARAEAAEQKIFECRFVGTLFAAQIAREDVKAEGHGF